MSDWYTIAKNNLENPNFNEWDSLLILLINEFNKHEKNFLVQDIVIRCLERRSEIDKSFILDHLLGELGLFPYICNKNISSKDTFRNILFGTPQDEEKIFHIKQAEVFHRIMNGENIVLSAPTSFGKSLIIEALIASFEFDNIVIVVPTIALIDELKKKFYKYKDHYKIVSQVNQNLESKNIFILTQERVLEFKERLKVDFFIIDEFYKLEPTSDSDVRSDRLNIAFKELYSKCQRFYMLGPRINGLVEGIEQELRCKFLQFDSYITVSTNYHYHELNTKGKDEEIDIERDKILLEILNSLSSKEQTIIFCKSPQRACNLLKKILNFNIFEESKINEDFAHWLSENFHPDWSLVKGIKHRIAFHHGQIPRSVAALIVDLFNECKINILICTSTLIEGVNTNAKNIIIYDDCITGKKKLDMFTFNNISGRSGRMFKHYVGNVYILGDKPELELPFIDMPIITQSEKASDILLLSLGDDINENNKEKVKRFYEQSILPLHIILKHQSINPNDLIGLAEDIKNHAKDWNKIMSWSTAYPAYPQLLHICELLYEHFNIKKMGNGSVYSASQLERKIKAVMQKVDDKQLIINDYNYGSKKYKNFTIDDSIQSIFSFKKNLVGYNLPRLIYALNDIQEYIFNLYNYSTGDYKSFAANLENFYYPSALNGLEEFGLPNQVAKKIFERNTIEKPDEIDYVLDFLKSRDKEKFEYLDDFENKLLNRVFSYFI
ncbi:DEAD/DEAH box helicase [Acinetobacter sp. ANC 5378]|uniref:DEAD/DEAH box helicase n=1 Tax=Acinetobacter sp. ANC 5378 TaxID=2731249 RepID=UPI00148FD80E|nr:DEAD/DEAH box helicase [Acinetobacter sp. ANC 5378]NNG81332.1 DEAD/DEAH box helicase [Acinetobacter sp. ANC 5378]